MTPTEIRTALAGAFRELTLAVGGVFELYEVDDEVADAAAEAIGVVFRSHIDRVDSTASGSGLDAMRELLDEIDAVIAEQA